MVVPGACWACHRKKPRSKRASRMIEGGLLLEWQHDTHLDRVLYPRPRSSR